MPTSSSATSIEAIDTFLPFMRDVMRCEHSLRELGLMWRMIEAGARMHCPIEAQAILPTIAAARSGFEHLEHELVAGLVREKVNRVLEETGTQAQHVIDIVVRNLYERTADVGFLATDRELCAFVAGMNGDAGAISARLKSYRSKYTVYDDIMLLDTEGRVLMHIDDADAPCISRDALVAATLAADGFVETFRASDLRPSKRQALIYSRRMHHPESGTVVGVLCLCFNFEEEMAGIFRSYRDEGARSNLLLVDAQQRVIASADPTWMPLGSMVPTNRAGTAQPMISNGREYLIRTFPAAGYQGYMGPPGWQGQVMIPVDTAFRGERRNAMDQLAPDIAAGLMTYARRFCPPLHDIVDAADTIRRVVWNGQAMTAGQQGDRLKLQTVLNQIGETGARSNEVFSQSIGDLYGTVLSTRLRGVEFIAHLLVDLLDRNLYERSDDCRWWALTPELGQALGAEHVDAEATCRIASILEYINRLYTVYTRIVVYDRHGRIIADSSRDGAASVAGQQIDAATLQSVLGLRDEQRYHVTPFAPDPLYDGRPTYVYHAAIRMPGQPAQIVGGIGIVFDAEVELAGMLGSAMSARDEMSAFFIDRSGRIISSTDAAHPVGTRLEIDASLLAINHGELASRLVEHDGQYAAMACCACRGYREFRASDDYRDDVLAVVFHAFGAVRASGARIDRERTRVHEAGAADGVEYASFFLNGLLFALPAAIVAQAQSAAAISRISMGKRSERIGVLARGREDGDGSHVWVFDLGRMLLGASGARTGGGQVIVLRSKGKEVGVLVDELHDVHKFAPGQITPMPFSARGQGVLVEGVIRANGGSLLLQALDVEGLFACVNDPDLPTVLPAQAVA